MDCEAKILITSAPACFCFLTNARISSGVPVAAPRPTDDLAVDLGDEGVRDAPAQRVRRDERGRVEQSEERRRPGQVVVVRRAAHRGGCLSLFVCERRFLFSSLRSTAALPGFVGLRGRAT